MHTERLNGLSSVTPNMQGIEELEQFTDAEVTEALVQMGFGAELARQPLQQGLFSVIGGIAKGIGGGIKSLVNKIKDNKALKELGREALKGILPGIKLPPPVAKTAPLPTTFPTMQPFQFQAPMFAPSGISRVMPEEEIAMEFDLPEFEVIAEREKPAMNVFWPLSMVVLAAILIKK